MKLTNKFTSVITAICLAVVAVNLQGCNQKQPVATADRLEEARSTAKSNAEFNAQQYRAANPRFTADFSIVSRSDAQQTHSCPQGDGWADLSIMKVDGKNVDKTSLKCSTYSSSVGCYRVEDFNKDKSLVGQEGTCQSTVPYPLPILKK